MPVPLGPVKFVCPRCHWQRTIMMPSDVICLPEWARCCPRCGCNQMQQARGNRIESILGTLAERLSRALN